MLEIIKISLIAYMFVYLGKPDMIFAWYQRLIDRIPYDWIFKPLGGCLKCFTGQVMMWYYIAVHHENYQFVEHLFFICAGITLVTIYDKIFDWLDGTETY